MRWSTEDPKWAVAGMLSQSFELWESLKSLNQDLQDELDKQDYLRLNEITGTDQIA